MMQKEAKYYPASTQWMSIDRKFHTYIDNADKNIDYLYIWVSSVFKLLLLI